MVAQGTPEQIAEHPGSHTGRYLAPLPARMQRLMTAWADYCGSEGGKVVPPPQTPPLPWDELMHQPAYQHALEKLP